MQDFHLKPGNWKYDIYVDLHVTFLQSEYLTFVETAPAGVSLLLSVNRKKNISRCMLHLNPLRGNCMVPPSVD